MPLLIFAGFFAALFLFEIAWYLAGAAAREREMARYQRVEHPRRPAGSRYFDMPE